MLTDSVLGEESLVLFAEKKSKRARVVSDSDSDYIPDGSEEDEVILPTSGMHYDISVTSHILNFFLLGHFCQTITLVLHYKCCNVCVQFMFIVITLELTCRGEA